MWRYQNFPHTKQGGKVSSFHLRSDCLTVQETAEGLNGAKREEKLRRRNERKDG